MNFQKILNFCPLFDQIWGIFWSVFFCQFDIPVFHPATPRAEKLALFAGLKNFGNKIRNEKNPFKRKIWTDEFFSGLTVLLLY